MTDDDGSLAWLTAIERTWLAEAESDRAHEAHLAAEADLLAARADYHAAVNEWREREGV
jgi:hypothetical protein